MFQIRYHRDGKRTTCILEQTEKWLFDKEKKTHTRYPKKQT